MFSNQKRCKIKLKFSGTKVCKAEEVRKYFVNPKIESFRLVCKLHYLSTVWISDIQKQLSGDVFRNRLFWKFCNVEFLFNKVASLQTSNLIKNRFQHRCLSVKFSKSLRTSFLRNTSRGCFWKYLMNSLFIAYENNESCHCVVCSGSPELISFYRVCFVFFYFFHFFLFSCGFYYLFRYRGKFVNT